MGSGVIGEKKSVCIIGGTFAGNKGAAGMLESVIFNLNDRFNNNATFQVVSVYPARDRSRPIPDNTTIVSAPPIKLVLILPAISFIYTLLKKCRLPRGLFLRWPLLKAIAEADVLVDISGIAYVDGRIATLFYNVACNLPGILLGVPIVKMSQAIGPVKTTLNRMAAKTILHRCTKIFGRGTQTCEFLAELELENYELSADLAFVLNDRHPIPAAPLARGIGKDGRPVIGVSPSQVLADHLSRHKKDLVTIFAEYLDDIQAKLDADIVIVAHSLLGPDIKSRNNDYHVCKALFDHLSCRQRATLAMDDFTPSELRALISNCDAFVACRFHSMISALCVKVPCLVPAWSHKYEEVMSDFGLQGYVLGIESITPDNLVMKTRELVSDAESIIAQIERGLPNVMDSARGQLEYVAKLIEKRGGTD